MAVDAADAWWDGLPPERRAQIHRWVAGDRDDGPGEWDQPLPTLEGMG